MSYIQKDLIFHLHAALAENGQTQGQSNRWFNLKGGTLADLHNFDGTSESGWVGDNTPANPYALKFDGKADYVSILAPASVTGNFTFEVSFYYDGGSYIVNSGAKGNTRGFIIRVNELGELVLETKSSTKTGFFNMGVIEFDKWYHIVGVHSVTDNRIYGYQNGAPYGFKSLTDTVNSSPPLNLVIGTEQDDKLGWFHGQVVLLRLYERDLKGYEVAQNYQAGRLRTDTSKNITSSIIVPWANNVKSSMMVATSARLTSRYGVHKANRSDITGHLSITRFKDLPSSMVVNKITSITARYSIVPIDKSDLDGSIDVYETSDKPGTIDVIQHAILRGNYGVSPSDSTEIVSSMEIAHSNDVESSLYINSSAKATARYGIKGRVGDSDTVGTMYVEGPVQRVSTISVNVYERMTARYKIGQFVECSDTASSLSVTKFNDLKSLIDVNSSAKLTAKYDIVSGGHSNIPSELAIHPDSKIKGSMTVAPVTSLTATYAIQGVHIYDLPASMFIMATRQIPSSLTVNTNASMSVKYDIEKAGNADLTSYLNISGTYSLPSLLKVSSQSTLRGRYGITGIWVADLSSNLEVREVNDLPSDIGIYSRTRMIVKYGVAPIYFSDRPSSLTIKEKVDLPSVLSINPYNRMTVNYEVMEKPRYEMSLTSVRDAFVRSNVPTLNYGSEGLLSVGRTSNGERFRAYFGFDITKIPQVNTTVGTAILKLYIGGRNLPLTDVKLHVPSKDWVESGITWAGSVQGYNSATYDDYEVIGAVGGYNGYYEFDITQLVRDWYDGVRPNYGLLLRLADELTAVQTFEINAKESFERVPTLDISYYSTLIPSIGIEKLPGEITVSTAWQSDKKGSIKINQYNKWKNLFPGSLKVKNPYDNEGHILVTRPDLVSGVGVVIPGESTRPCDIQVVTPWADEITGYIYANPVTIGSEIYIYYRSDVEGSITARQDDKPSDCTSYIYVNPVHIVSQIGVRRDDLGEVPGSITVHIPSLTSSISVNKPDDIPSKIGVRVWEEYDLPSDGYVRYYDSLNCSVFVTSDVQRGSISVFNYFSIPSTIYVQNDVQSDKDSFITVLYRENLDSSLFVRSTVDIPSNLWVASGNWGSSIGVQRTEEIDRKGTITARREGASDTPSSAFVFSGYLGSMITVQQDSESYVSASITVQTEKESSIPSNAFVIGKGESDVVSYIEANKFRETQKGGLIGVRVEGEKDLFTGDITIKVWGKDGDLHSSIPVRRDAENDKTSSIAVRVRAVSDMFSGFMDIFNTSHLDSNISVTAQNRMTVSYVTIPVDWSDVPSSMEIHEWSQIPSSISVRRWDEDDKLSSISVWEKSTVPGFIEVWENSAITGSIEVWEKSLLPGQFIVRQFGKAERVGTIGVNSHNKMTAHYSIIPIDWSDLPSSVDVYEWNQIPSSISVRRWAESNKSSSISVWEKSLLPGSIEVWEKSLLPGSIEVWEKSLLPGTITVRQECESDKVSYIAVRREGESVLKGSINARRNGEESLSSDISVWEKNLLDCEITILFRNSVPGQIEVNVGGPYAFIM
jgi:hypothetical protein